MISHRPAEGSSMRPISMSNEEFGLNPSRATEASACGPVFVTSGGAPAYVLLSIDDFRRLTHASTNIVELISADGADAIEFEPPRSLEGSVCAPGFGSK
jgi:PHD/YefM family antitoxin component YafN of YafNO toxin-antitoxin module